jgi:hypothetical protein
MTRVTCIQNYHNSNQARSLNNFALGCKANTIDIQNWLNNQIWPNTDIVAFQGILRGNNVLFKWLVKNQKPYYYIDHAPFFHGYNPTSEWMRVSRSEFMPSKYKECPSDRWNKYFSSKINIHDWCLSGKPNILVLPPTSAIKFIYPESKNWLTETITKLKQYTDRTIIIREKPDQPLLDDIGNIVGRSEKITHHIKQDLANAHCVVAYSTGSAIEAALQGIPVIINEVSPAYHISNSIEQIENLQAKDRQSWLNWMAYNQFTSEEFKSGHAWRILSEN